MSENLCRIGSHQICNDGMNGMFRFSGQLKIPECDFLSEISGLSCGKINMPFVYVEKHQPHFLCKDRGPLGNARGHDDHLAVPKLNTA